MKPMQLPERQGSVAIVPSASIDVQVVHGVTVTNPTPTAVYVAVHGLSILPAYVGEMHGAQTEDDSS